MKILRRIIREEIRLLLTEVECKTCGSKKVKDLSQGLGGKNTKHLYCPDCKVISYMKDTFSFSVPHFTTYSLFAWASYSGYCGDGLCSLYESCHDCKNDCGECKDEPDDEPGTGIGPCEELWVCSGWSECNELNLRERECMDVNLCGTRDKKPLEM